MSPEHVITSREARSMQTRWIKQNKARIGEICLGFAWVLQSQAQLLLYKPILALQGKRMMGCPTAVFGDMDSAVMWVNARLTPAER